MILQSGTGETQLVTLPLAMANAISNQQANQQTAVQQPQQDNTQPPAVQVNPLL